MTRHAAQKQTDRTVEGPDTANSPRRLAIAEAKKAAPGKSGYKTVRASEDPTQLVTFLLKNEEFGFDIMSVQEIIRLPKMARLPHTPDFVEGISNLRGVVLPIVDIRARFGMKREERTDRSRVLVIDIDGRRIGLLVDGVRQVTRVGRHEFEPPPAAIRSEAVDYIDGVVKLDNGERIIIALDARRVCSFGTNKISRLGGAAGGTAVMNGSADQAMEQPKQELRTGTTEGERSEDGSAESGWAKSRRSRVQQLVSFQVGREEFAFPMEHVREILRVQTPKEVPGAPDHLLGVLTVRGKILPIVDLRRLLGQSTFAQDHIEACHAASADYTALLALHRAGDLIDLGSALAASERLRRWLSEFNSSSQVLMETLTKARSLNEHVSGLASRLGSRQPAADGMQTTYDDVLETAKAIVSALQIFEGHLEDNIREDQRIIVVDSNGFQLGLVVDHVNEVLGVPEESIEAAPDLSDNERVGLSGIAKLEDGNRLILLLATDNLLDRQNLAKIAGGAKESAGANLASKGDRSEAGGTGGAPGRATGGEDLQLVTFLLGKEEYGIPIARIQEIDRLAKVTQTPRAPRFVEGVTNLRGEVIPVLSTRALFALEDKVSDDRTRVIIVDMGGTKTGLVVDSVKQVLSIAAKNIAPPPTSLSNGAEGQFISGIGNVDEGKRMIVLLDVERVLTRGECSELAAMKQSA